MNLFILVSEWLKETASHLGGLGLMLLAIGDSSFLSLPEVNDLLLMKLSMDNHSRMLVLAMFTTMGSVMGCSLLYAIGRKGGEAFLQKRKGFGGDRMAKLRAWYGKFGILAIVIPSLLPPPTPFKIFVLSAGTFGISWPSFLIAVTIGRGIRYFGEGYLAVRYGDAAIDFAKQNFGWIGLALSGTIVVSTIAFVYLRRKRNPQ